jgi:hypothetical protein
MADNALRTPSGSQPIRAVDKGGGVLTQATAIDIGGTGAEALLSNTNPMPVVGPSGMPQKIQDDRNIDASGRNNPGQIIFHGPLRGDTSGTGWNDGVCGVGGASIDNNILFDNHPTIRLDCQGNTASGSTPGASPLTTGVVYKTRMQFPLAHVYSNEMWLRWSSQNNGTNSFTVLDHYNRNGTNAYLGRIWLDNTLDPISCLYLNSSGTYTQFLTQNSFPATHMYDPANGSLDEVGQWSFVRVWVDFTNQKYVGVQVNDTYVDLSAQSLHALASTGARAMHFGISYAQKTTTRRYMHIAKHTGRYYG